jgi:hypothetical protein
MSAGEVGLGFRVKSGYAVAIALSGSPASPIPLLRRILELSDPDNRSTRQPFHEGMGTAQKDLAVIARLEKTIESCAGRSVAQLLNEKQLAGRPCRAACLVVGSTIDPAVVANPHIRAHANEGRLFRTVLTEALHAQGIGCSVIVEKQLQDEAAAGLRSLNVQIAPMVARFGRTLGKPWRADDKAAATAAWLALGGGPP